MVSGIRDNRARGTAGSFLKEHLAAHGVEIEKEIDWGNSRTIYFRDPSHNSVEIASPMLWGISEETLPAPAGEQDFRVGEAARAEVGLARDSLAWPG